MPVQNSEVLIAAGLHQFQHGRIASIDTATEIPFAHVELRGAKGQLLVTRGAYVPLKYCVELEPELIRSISAEAKARRKARRQAERAALDAAILASQPRPMSWA